MIPARLIGATGVFLKNTLLVLFSTIIILAAANVLISIFLDESSGNSPKPEDKSQFPTEQLIAKYGAFLAEAFPVASKLKTVWKTLQPRGLSHGNSSVLGGMRIRSTNSPPRAL
jgi:hypothetical protein